MENTFCLTIYDMYRNMGLSEKEIDEILSSIFDETPIEFD